MANKVLNRVWEHSEQRGAARCLILAIADVADADGIAYPGVAYLAKLIREDEDYTFRLLRKVIATGELLHKPGGGRGKKTLYAVACGLSEAQIAQLNTVLQCRVTSDKNTAPQSREKRNTGLQNTVIERDKHWTILDTNQSSFDAPEPGATAINENMIHGRSMDDSSSKNARDILRDCGLYNATIRKIIALGIDEATLIASVQNLAAAGWGAGAIANELRDNPPKEGHPYERPIQPDVSQNQPKRAKGLHNGTGGAELKNPGARQRLIEQAERGELP